MPDGHRHDRTNPQACLTARPISRAAAKAEVSEPIMIYRIVCDQQIKATPGITGWYRPRVQIDGGVRHLDVGSSHPGAGEGPKGLAVRQLKRYASWVQTVVRQVGPYLLQAWRLEGCLS